LLRLGIALVDEQPVAAQLWIVNEGIASIYKLAYDEQFSKYSIGSILTAHLMEYVMECDRVREVDYLIGDDPYKRSWMSHRRERWGVRAFNLRSVNGMCGVVKHIGGSALKKSLKNVCEIFRRKTHRSDGFRLLA
jgi:CelD/BcsL family acetyltransferase involved in cellulose biosynthesis